MKSPVPLQSFIATTVALVWVAMSQNLWAHVPHDIIYSLGVSPDYAEDGLVFSSSTQFGESHLVSHNHGETYSESNTGMTRALVTGHVFSPNFKTDGTVFLVTKIGYYKSTDRGAKWVKQAELPNQTILALALAPDFAESGDHYLLTKTTLLAVPGDGAREVLTTHDEIQLGKLLVVEGTLYVHRVAYPVVPKKKGMEVIDYQTGTVETYDIAAKSWELLDSSFADAIISDLDITQKGDDLAFVVALKNGSIHLSEDSGATWSKTLHRDVDFTAKVAFSPNYAQDGTIAAAMAKGFLFFTQDGGESWEVKSNGLSRWVHHSNIHANHLVFSPDYQNDQTIFLGKTTGVYKTTDRGDYWRHVNVWNPKWGYFVYPAPNQGSKDVFTATYNSGISRSHDGGDTWQSANLGITSAFANSMELSPNYAEDETIFVVDIVTGLYRSADGGRSWEAETALDISQHYEEPILFRQFGISPNYRDNGLMFVFTVPRRTLGLSEKHVWKYNDQTRAVKRVLIGGTSNYINDFGFSPQGAAEEAIYAASAQGLFVSKDQGDTWTLALKGNFDKILVSPNLDRDGLIYLMGSDGSAQVSRDAGLTFAAADFDLGGQPIENLTFSPDFANDGTLYAATFGAGVFRSTDQGAIWEPFALRDKLLYTGLAFSPDYPTDRTMYAPAIDGIYRSIDAGETWEEVLNQFQLLPKVPLVTLRNPEGHEMSLGLDVEQIKQYGGYDPEVSPGIHEVNRRVIKTVESDEAYLARYYEFSGAAGYAIEVNFYGTAIEYQCVTGPDLGIVDLYLDGEKQGSFDLYSAEETFDVTGFQKGGLEEAFHTLRIVATGKKNSASSGIRINFNAAVVGTHSNEVSESIEDAGSASQATGYIRVEQIDGVWWFINAEGERFISLGVNHIEPHLWLAPYNREATLERYGSDLVDDAGRFNTDGQAARKWTSSVGTTAATSNSGTPPSEATPRATRTDSSIRLRMNSPSGPM